MFNKFKKILTQPRVAYKPLIEVRIFKSAILHNLKRYQQKYPEWKFAPVLKSNAYGHGLIQVASILDKEYIAFFMVDSFYEALLLRREGIISKILVLGYATMEQISKAGLKDVSFAIIDLAQLKNIAENLRRKTSFHLKIDTGMHRQGILPSDLEEAENLIKQNPNICLEGICSHLADADSPDDEFTNQQIDRWNAIADEWKKKFSGIRYLHLSNTAGAGHASRIHANVGRIGIGLYGFNTSATEPLDLKPALEISSFITTLKTIPKGEKVGYNITYTAAKETRIATIPVGYNEGLDIRLSNKGFVKIKNVFCPIIGRISMNMCSIDVSEVNDIQLEDEVNVISRDPADKNSIENIIRICSVSRYEIPIHIPQHLRRVII